MPIREQHAILRGLIDVANGAGAAASSAPASTVVADGNGSRHHQSPPMAVTAAIAESNGAVRTTKRGDARAQSTIKASIAVDGDTVPESGR